MARNRIAGAKFAQFAGASVIVMDDGFQNPSLAKDLAILVVDGRRGIGNGHMIPAGPLRAPLGVQLDRAQALIVVGAGDATAAILPRAQARGIATFHARLEPEPSVIAAIGRGRVLAFAGIGDPEKFFATLTEAGVDVVERIGLPDHHRYTVAEAQDLLARAQAQNLMLVTTEKDLARLSGGHDGDPRLAALAEHASALPVRLVVDEQDAFRQMVLRR